MLSTLIEQTLPLVLGEKAEFGIKTPIPDLLAFHSEQDLRDMRQLQIGGVCLILQGQKDVLAGNYHYQYSAGEFVCYTMDLPIVTQYKTDNSRYLDLRLFFDMDLMREAIKELQTQNFVFKPLPEERVVSKASPDLIRAFELLLSLSRDPQGQAILLPLAKKAVYYYLLTSEQGAILRQMAMRNSNTERIAQAVRWLKMHYNKPVNIETLAKQSEMSISGFYALFRQIVGISPLQYQKNLRLTKAQTLIQARSHSISEAATEVGYESLPQFSREYKRYFGYSPSKDSKSLN